MFFNKFKIKRPCNWLTFNTLRVLIIIKTLSLRVTKINFDNTLSITGETLVGLRAKIISKIISVTLLPTVHETVTAAVQAARMKK